MNKILVTGATGNLGAAVINSLLNKTNPGNLVALVRDLESDKVNQLKTKGIEVRKGDYSDHHSLVNAFKGIDKLYFVSGNDVANRNTQHKTVIDAAKEAGVKHVIYTSVPRKNETAASPLAVISDSHIKTENWLKESGLKYTFLKHNIYLEMLPIFLGEQVLESGVVYFPAGEGKVGFTSRLDMAEAAAAILTGEGHENRSYDITNNNAVSFHQIAEEVSKVSGKTINYVSPSPEEYISTLSAAGVPAEYIHMFAGLGEGFKQQELDQTNDVIETLIGRKPISTGHFLAQVYASKNS